MITDVLIEHRWLAPTALALLVALGPLAGTWLAPRPRTAAWMAGASLLPVTVLTLVPVDRELFSRCEVAWSLPTLGRVELLANVVLFIAPALLATVATRRPLAVLVAATVLSAAVEAVQAAVTAIGRSCDTNDWLSNTIGAVIGAALGAIALRIRARQDERTSPPTAIGLGDAPPDRPQ